MGAIRRVAVFCGSSTGARAEYAEQAARFGEHLVSAGVELVYGGGNVGLMGTIADAVLQAGGRVTGIIPEALKHREIAHPGLTSLRIVRDMHERKAGMAELADAFVALPGGAGTMEEIFEAWTWAMLGYHEKPCAFFNVNGYFDALLSFVERMQQDAFLRPQYRDMLIVETDPETLVDRLQSYQPPQSKWS